MSVDYVEMGKRIREIRESKGLTQAALSELAGIEPSNLSHIERAATKVSLPTLINIANALEVSLDELVCGSLVKSEHISVQRIDELLSDCSPFELKAIYEMLKTIKTVLRKYGERLTIIVYFCLTDSIDGDAQLYTETHNLLLCT